MQLPPTVLSLDEGKRKKKLADKTKNKPAPTKKTTPAPEKTTPKAAPPEADNPEGSSSEKESGSEDGGMDDADADDEDKSVLEGPAVSKPKKTTKRGQLQRLCPPKTLETTLFDRLERMYGPSIKKMLKVQYRMHATIGAFPSKTLYASKLVPHASVAARLLRDLPNVSAEEDEADVLEMPVVFFDTAGCEYYERVDGDGDEGSKCNENEATVVKQWVEKLVGAGVLPAQIAIITPYQAQVQLLTTLLRPVYGPEIEIGSVDGMQGREKDAVIISLVRSNSLREVGFLKEKRRLNVAMTRAKRHLCVVGDSSTVQHGSSFLKRWMAWLEENADVRFAEV